MIEHEDDGWWNLWIGSEMISTGRVRRAGGTLVMTFTPRMSNFGIEQIRGMLFTATYHDECEG